MRVTEAGMFSSLSMKQLQKALLPMLVTLSAMVTDVTCSRL